MRIHRWLNRSFKINNVEYSCMNGQTFTDTHNVNCLLVGQHLKSDLKKIASKAFYHKTSSFINICKSTPCTASTVWHVGHVLSSNLPHTEAPCLKQTRTWFCGRQLIISSKLLIANIWWQNNKHKIYCIILQNIMQYLSRTKTISSK